MLVSGMRGEWHEPGVAAVTVSELHLEHARQLFLSERARRESIRASLSTPVAAISFAVFALSSLSLEVNVDHWRQWPTAALISLGAAAVTALFASAYQVIMSEWLFVYHEPPRLTDLLGGAGESAEDPDSQFRKTLTRRHDQRRFSDLPPRVRQRLTLAARELREAEAAIAAALGLPEPPRLMMIDEEEAVIVLPSERDGLLDD